MGLIFRMAGGDEAAFSLEAEAAFSMEALLAPVALEVLGTACDLEGSGLLPAICALPAVDALGSTDFALTLVLRVSERAALALVGGWPFRDATDVRVLDLEVADPTESLPTVGAMGFEADRAILALTGTGAGVAAATVRPALRPLPPALRTVWDEPLVTGQDEPESSMARTRTVPVPRES
jgi:hypothetical protein